MLNINIFKNAFNGIKIALKTEKNLRIQFVLALFTVFLGLFFQISLIEWTIIGLCACLVLSFELFNTALENLADFVHIEKHPKIKIVKDVAAGAVLLSAIISLAIGFIIFLPKIMDKCF